MTVEDRWNERNGSPRRIADAEVPSTGSRPQPSVKREEHINDDRDRYLAAPRHSPPQQSPQDRPPRKPLHADWRETTQPVPARWPAKPASPGTSDAASGHAGKGPKGYNRSDERLLEAVCERLEEDARIDASDISVTVRDADVVLEGSVPDRESKHRAEDLAAGVGGVQEVYNRLRARKGSLR